MPAVRSLGYTSEEFSQTQDTLNLRLRKVNALNCLETCENITSLSLLRNFLDSLTWIVMLLFEV